jgi:hypothetical protein
MAITYAVSDLSRNVVGSQRLHSALLTITGTNTADGDAITAAAMGLELFFDVDTDEAADSTTSPTAVFQTKAIVATNKLSALITFWGTNAAPGAAVADPEVTAGTTLTGSSFRIRAWGR